MIRPGSLRKKRKRGGQKGHPKHQRQLIPGEQCTETFDLVPERCRKCGADLQACKLCGQFDPRQPQFRIPRRVVKGGSHLCAPNYCLRYRPAARQPQMVETGMSHIGFRCIVRP